MESFLETVNIGLDVVVAEKDFLSLFNPFLIWVVYIVNNTEDVTGSHKVCDGHLGPSKEVSLVRMEAFVDKVSYILGYSGEDLMSFCIKLQPSVNF